MVRELIAALTSCTIPIHLSEASNAISITFILKHAGTYIFARRMGTYFGKIVTR